MPSYHYRRPPYDACDKRPGRVSSLSLARYRSDDCAYGCLQYPSIAAQLRVAQFRRRGSELKLVIEGGADATRGRIDPVLIKLIARAHDWMQLVTSGRIRSIKELTEREGLTGSYITRVMRLSFLAPDIVAAILEGRQPPDLTAKTLLCGIDLPVSWEEQRTALGFRPA